MEFRSFLILFIILNINTVLVSAQNTQPILTLNTEMHTATIRRISTDKLGNVVLTCSNDKTAKLWDATTGKLLLTFRVPIDEYDNGMLYSGAISPDGNTVVLGGWTSQDGTDNRMYIYDVRENKLIRSISGFPHRIYDIEFSKDGSFIAIALGGENGIRIYETNTWSLKKSFTDYKASSNDIAWDNSGRLASVCNDGKIRLYSNNFELLKAANTQAGQQPSSIAFSPDNSLIAIGYDDSYKLQVFDGKTLEFSFEPDISGANSIANRLEMVSFSYDGNYLIAGCYYKKDINDTWWYQIRVWNNMGKGSYSDYSAALNGIMDIKPMPDNSFIFSGSHPNFGRITIGGNRIFMKTSETNAYNASDKEHFKINENGDLIEITPYGSDPIAFSIVTNTLLNLGGTTSGLASYTDRCAGVQVTDWQTSYSPKINAKSTRFLKPDERNSSVDISSNGSKIVFGTCWNIYCTNSFGEVLWSAPVQGTAFAVNISENDKVVAAALGNGIISWYNMENGKLMFSLFLHPDNKHWVLWSPDGYFDCSSGADNLMGWHVNQGYEKEALYYPAGQFFEKFYTPNLGARTLAGELFSDKEVNLSNMKLPPLVNTNTSNMQNRTITFNNSIKSESQTIEISVEVTDQGGGIDEILLYHNGKLIETTNRGYKPIEKKDEKSIKKYTINLTNGKNIIKATAFNMQRTEAIPNEIVIEYTGSETIKPNLYIIAIGINEYKNSKYNLNYAVADAQGFKDLIESNSNTIFNSVNTVYLTNSDATKQRIFKEISSIEKVIKQEDVFIFYYAGHGVMSDEDVPQFYITPYDVTQLYGNSQILLNEGISANELKNYSTKIIAQKQLYILDACQSGGMVGLLASRGAVEEKAINQLARSTGTYWLAASNTDQFAGEFAELKHGLFTYCLLEGLSGNADAQNDKKITVQEVSTYINDQLPLISKQYRGAAQYPNIFGYGQDFPLTIVKE